MENKYISKHNIFFVFFFFEQKSLSLSFTLPNSVLKIKIFIYEKKLYKL